MAGQKTQKITYENKLVYVLSVYNKVHMQILLHLYRVIRKVNILLLIEDWASLSYVKDNLNLALNRS